MRIESGTRGVISAAHRDVFTNSLHGHTYEVVAWWEYDGISIVKKKEHLDRAVTLFDHTCLANEFSWAEDMGRMLLKELNCVRLEINRPLEGFFCLVYRE